MFFLFVIVLVILYERSHRNRGNAIAAFTMLFVLGCFIELMPVLNPYFMMDCTKL